MKITVIVAVHKKYRMPEEKCYLPLHVGREGKENIGFVGDNTGDNISRKNPYYCELTGLYWMWKNMDSDYMGLVHYRRYFAGKQGTGYGDKFDQILTEREIKSLLAKNDIILPKKGVIILRIYILIMRIPIMQSIWIIPEKFCRKNIRNTFQLLIK